VHTGLTDELQAVIRPETEDATSEILGQLVHVDGGQATDGSFGVVAIRAARNVVQCILGRCDAQVVSLPAHGFQDRPDLLVTGKIANQRYQELAGFVQPTFVPRTMTWSFWWAGTSAG